MIALPKLRLLIHRQVLFMRNSPGLCGSPNCFYGWQPNNHGSESFIAPSSLDSGLRKVEKLVLAAITVVFLLLGSPALADGHNDESHTLNHVSVLIGGTHIRDADETAFTIGLDYEHQVSEILGLGFVVEHAFADTQATTVLAVADVHVWQGLVIQTGPGVEFVDDEEYFVSRFGLLYEFELRDHFTLAPQVHYDVSEGEDAVVFGVAIGHSF